MLFHDRMGIEAAALGAVIGSFLHLGIRLVGMRKTSVRVRFRLDLRMPALREFVRLMVPKMISHPIEPLTFLFFTAVASTLVAGSVSAVSFARNFQSVPVALIGVAISLAVFPDPVRRLGGGRPPGLQPPGADQRADDLGRVDPRGGRAARGRAAGDRGAARRRGVRREDVRLTATVLAAFALAVPFDALGHLLSRSLYATHNTLLPLGAAVGGFVVTIVVTLASSTPSGSSRSRSGFAAGLAVRTVLQAIALAWRLRSAPAGRRPRRPRSPPSG